MTYILPHLYIRAALIGVIICLTACRGDDEILTPVTQQTVATPDPANLYSGIYLLNEGNMGSNKATLDFLDLHTGIYHRNIFPTINPHVVFSLGDVGNDIQQYGSKLYAVINASHLIEVMEAGSGKHLGQVSLPNCRYLAFHNGKAYATSYAGPIALDPHAPLGEVVEIDTTTLTVTRRTAVGYQPDGIAVAEGRLFVANSGGYRTPHYDDRISVVRLEDFTVEQEIKTAPNLHRILAAPNGKLYVSSRGDYGQVAPRVCVVDPRTRQVTDTLAFAASSWWLDEDFIYAIGSQYHRTTKQYRFTMTKYDTREARVVSESFISPTVFAQMKQPYGIAVHPTTKQIYVADATNFTSQGKLYAFNADGELLWETQTGDIPGHFSFLSARFGKPQLSAQGAPTVTRPTAGSPYPDRVLSYRPAPGQFVNKLPEATSADTESTMNAKALKAISNGGGGITLGGYGGSLTVAFDHRIENKDGAADIRITGNAFDNNSEAGIVQVAMDRNGNGKPDDDEWYELKGSAYAEATKHYQIVYTRPENDTDDVPWRDNQGQTGYILRNEFHTQAYYPLWLADTLTFIGSCLPPNARNIGTAEQQHWILPAFAWGYADNNSLNDFDIDNAVDAQGHAVYLPGVDFVRVYTGLNQRAGWLGETSTEIFSIADIHALQP